MNPKNKGLGNLWYNDRFHLLLGNKKYFKIFIDRYGDVMLKYGEENEFILSEYKEDLQFFQDLIK